MTLQPLHFASLDLLSFRGVERMLSLDFGRRLTIIYGGNATGKSSIAQALEFAITGRVRDYEDSPIPSQYLANTRAIGPGHVYLRTTDDTPFSAATDEAHTAIERRFRDLAAVDWPERQPIPLTTTHLTTQGMLARVLGSSNAVTRNDLSGLCAGAHLRFLVTRAERLADHFRQAASGRNVQAELRDSHAAYQTAKLLHESLMATGTVGEVSESALDARLNALNVVLSLPPTSPVSAVQAHLAEALGRSEDTLRRLQRLLSQARELGQSEAEFADLQKEVAGSKAKEDAMRERLVAARSLLSDVTLRLQDTMQQKVKLVNETAAHEERRQQLAIASAMELRARDTREAVGRSRESLAALKDELSAAQADLAANTARLSDLRQERDGTAVQIKTVDEALALLADVPLEPESETRREMDEAEAQVRDAEIVHERVSAELEQLRQTEKEIGAQVGVLTESGEKLIASARELGRRMTDGQCPLCGHDHGSREHLDQSIELTRSVMMQGARELGQTLVKATAAREERQTAEAEARERLQEARAEIARFRDAAAARSALRNAVVTAVDERLRLALLTPSLDTASLKRTQDIVASRLSGLDRELETLGVVARAGEARRSQLERTIAARAAEVDQLLRLVADLDAEAKQAKLAVASLPEGADTTRDQLAAIEGSVKNLERELGQAQANVTEVERAIAVVVAERMGNERRLEVVAGFLKSLDEELASIGASRDIPGLLALEQSTKRANDDLIALKSKATALEIEKKHLDANRAAAHAREQLAKAEATLKSVQERQQRLQKRSAEFKTLYDGLTALQEGMAEIVLTNIKQPVATVFQAMTAACPWDLELKLEEGRLRALLKDGQAEGPATALLNSAYLNVAAIAVRVALAAQQKWTRLRTVIMDDPILEMDHLTQSGLVDGIEAVMASAYAPWDDLQLILTTWSEDFAVMAAHKLAHLNEGDGAIGSDPARGREEFVIHRLSSDADGSITSQRHVPRWRARASAA